MLFEFEFLLRALRLWCCGMRCHASFVRFGEVSGVVCVSHGRAMAQTSAHIPTLKNRLAPRAAATRAPVSKKKKKRKKKLTGEVRRCRGSTQT